MHTLTGLQTRYCFRSVHSASRSTPNTCRSFAVTAPGCCRHHVQHSRLENPIKYERAAVQVVNAAEQEDSAFDYEEPETAREAIDVGLVLCKQQKWQQALGVFETALTLPGTGIKRYRDKPRLISDGEKMAALYNIACCYAQLQDARSGLVALSGCIEMGYTDWNQIRTDPDLEFLRQDPRFEGLMDRFQRKSGGFFGMDLSAIFGNK